MFLGLGGPGSPFTTLNASSQLCCRHGLACVLAPRLLTAVVLLMLLVLLLVDARTYMCDTQTSTAAPRFRYSRITVVVTVTVVNC